MFDLKCGKRIQLSIKLLDLKSDHLSPYIQISTFNSKAIALVSIRILLNASTERDWAKYCSKLLRYSKNILISNLYMNKTLRRLITEHANF